MTSAPAATTITNLSDSDLAQQGPSTLLCVMNRSNNAVGNVSSVQTTLAAGTDNQAFCYDEQNRLVWATSQSATNGGPNGCGASNTAGSLTSQGAQYTASYAYDALNRLTSSPLGTYTYGGAQLHAVTAVSNGYTAAYGNAGNMYCRAADSTTSCNGTLSGARMYYDHEGRLVAWQNTWNNPTSTASYAYDGEGHRVAQSVTTNGATSTTHYLAGGLEEQTGSTLTKYESVPGVCNVVIVGSGPSESISYVATDGLGSVSEALDGSGTVMAQQLYGPYGTGRFALGSMPTSKGYTGQYGDATTGLDYYGARYYDPLVGQFASADTDAKGGLNRYAYVAGNPETATDPTGHFRCDDSGCKRGGGNGGAGGCTFDCKGSPSGCQSNCSPKGGGSGGCQSDASCTCYTSCGSDPSGGNGTGGEANCSQVMTQACLQKQHISDLTKEAGVYWFVGLLFQAAALVVDWLSEGTIGKLERIIAAAALFTQLVAAAGQAFGGSGPLYVAAQKLAAGMNYLAGIASQALALIRAWGAIAQDAADLAVSTAQAAVGGLPSVLETLATKAFGSAVSFGLQGGAFYFFAKQETVNAEIAREENMNPTEWCSQVGGGACTGLPTS